MPRFARDVVCWVSILWFEAVLTLKRTFKSCIAVALNIVEGNSDDHFHRHCFLLTAKGWRKVAMRLNIAKREVDLLAESSL